MLLVTREVSETLSSTAYWERWVIHRGSKCSTYPDDLQSFIPLAFKTARAADPQAKLYINDYGLHNSTKLDPMVELVTRLNKQNPGLIDGIGTEMHLSVSLSHRRSSLFS